jgi:3-phytase
MVQSRKWILLGITILACALTCCNTPEEELDAVAAAPAQTIPQIAPVFATPRDTVDNIDSPAVWHGPNGEHWLLATAKEGDVIVVNDAATGALIRRVGGAGTAAGQLERPNGIAVLDSLLFVVERDNRRLQVLSLPDFRSLGTYGSDVLKYPYGITAHKDGDAYRLYVTDNYELPGEQIPPDSLLGERVHRFDVQLSGNGLDVRHAGSFGDTSGRGILRIVESLYADPAHDRLLIAEEEEPRSHIKVYDLSGRYTGHEIDSTYYPHQAEGIALYTCSNRDGFWVTTDQGEDVNQFHVFDRGSLAHVGSFEIEGVLNTDGIALTQQSFGPFKGGVFYAVHDDGNVAAATWQDIAQSLNLTCP